MIKKIVGVLLLATICSQAHAEEFSKPQVHVTYKSYYLGHDDPGGRLTVMNPKKLKKFNDSLAEMRLKDTIIDSVILDNKIFSDHTSIPVIEENRDSRIYTGYDMEVSTNPVTKRKTEIRTQLNQNFMEYPGIYDNNGTIDPQRVNVNFDSRKVIKKGQTIVSMVKSKGGMFYVLEETLEK